MFLVKVSPMRIYLLLMCSVSLFVLLAYLRASLLINIVILVLLHYNVKQVKRLRLLYNSVERIPIGVRKVDVKISHILKFLKVCLSHFLFILQVHTPLHNPVQATVFLGFLKEKLFYN